MTSRVLADLQVAGQSQWQIVTDAVDERKTLGFHPVSSGVQQPASLALSDDAVVSIVGGVAVGGEIKLSASHPLEVGDLPVGRHETTRWPGNPETVNYAVGSFVGVFLPVVSGVQYDPQLNEPVVIRTLDVSPLTGSTSREFFHADPLNNRTGSTLAGVWLNRGQFRKGAAYQRVA